MGKKSLENPRKDTHEDVEWEQGKISHLTMEKQN